MQGINKLENVDFQIIEEVKEGNCDLEGKLWSKEKYWQAQLFTLTHGFMYIFKGLTSTFWIICVLEDVSHIYW